MYVDIFRCISASTAMFFSWPERFVSIAGRTPQINGISYSMEVFQYVNDGQGRYDASIATLQKA